MITITAEAIAKIEQFVARSDPMDWFVTIQWRKGAAHNWRTPEGDAAWNIEPDQGWVAELGGWEPGKVPRTEGVPLCNGVRVLVQNLFAPRPFPGGEIYVDAGELKVREHAI